MKKNKEIKIDKIARLTGYTIDGIRQILSGKRWMPAKRMHGFSVALGIDIMILATGDHLALRGAIEERHGEIVTPKGLPMIWNRK